MIDENIIYFDNAANRLVEKRDVEQLSELLIKYPANIESRHLLAQSSKNALRDSSKKVVASLNLNNFDILYFSSGSEIFSFFNHILSVKFKNKNIITSKIEHPALITNLVNSKLEIKYLDVNDNYQFDKQKLSNLIDQNTVLVALNFVQSESGLIQKLDDLIVTIRKISPDIMILVDSIQGIGKLDLPYGADFYTISNHKLSGTYGAGLIYNKDLKIDIAKMYNDYRHKFYLSSRLETANLLLMGNKLIEAVNNQAKNYDYVKKINDFLRIELKKKFSSKAILFFEKDITTPYILNIVLPEYDGAIIAGLFSDKNIMISSSTACMAESNEPSIALKTLRIPQKFLFNTIRVSLSENNTIYEAEIFIKQLEKILENY